MPWIDRFAMEARIQVPRALSQMCSAAALVLGREQAPLLHLGRPHRRALWAASPALHPLLTLTSPSCSPTTRCGIFSACSRPRPQGRGALLAQPMCCSTALALPFCLLLKTALMIGLRKKGLVILWLTHKTTWGYQLWSLYMIWNKSGTISKHKDYIQKKAAMFPLFHLRGRTGNARKNFEHYMFHYNFISIFH